MINTNSTESTIIEGGTAAAAVVFLQQSVTRMIPYFLPAIALIILDLIYGVRAARVRGERIKFTTGLKMTATKTFSYICWIILASTLTVSFGKSWIEWAVLGLVFVNEFASIIGNYLETKGIRLSFGALYRWAFRKVGEKTGVEATSEEASEIFTDIKKEEKKDE